MWWFVVSLLASAPSLDTCVTDRALASQEPAYRALLLRKLDKAFAQHPSPDAARVKQALKALPRAEDKATRSEAWTRSQAGKAEARAARGSGMFGAEAWADAALLYVALGADEDARRCLAKARAVAKEASQDAFSAVPALSKIAQVEAGLGQKKAARSTVKQAERWLPKVSEGVRIGRHADVAEAYLALGDARGARRHVDDAMALARAQTDPRERRRAGSSLMHFGRMLVKRGRTPWAVGLLDAMDVSGRSNALSHYIEVAGYDDDCAAIEKLLGQYQDKNARVYEAVSQARGGCASYPGRDRMVSAAVTMRAPGPLGDVAKNRLATYYAAQKQWQAADKLIAGDKSRLQRMRAYADMARAAAQAGEVGWAKKWAHRVTEVADGSGTRDDQDGAWADAASTFYTVGAMAEGDAAAARIVRRGPFVSSTGWAWERAVGHIQRGEGEAAKAAFAQLEPDDQLHFAVIYLGDDKARASGVLDMVCAAR